MDKLITYLRLPKTEAFIKKAARLGFGLFALILIIIDGRQFLKNLSFGSTLHLLRTFTAFQLIGFLMISLTAIWLTFLYDFTAIRRLGLKIPTLRIMRVSFIANTFNNIAGFGGLGGAGARMLLYRSSDVSGKMIQRVSLMIIPATITGLGSLMLLNITGLTGVGPLIHEYKWLPLLIAGFAGYIPVFCWFTDIRFNRFHLNLSHSPNTGETKTRILMSLVSTLDWAAAAFVLWAILRNIHPGITYLEAAGLFSIATAAGITSMIPGGLGTFDLMLLSGLHVYGLSSEKALAALLLFRFFYYVVPLLGGAVLALGEASPFMLRFGKSVTQLLHLEYKPIPANSLTAIFGDLASRALYILILVGGLLLVISAATPGLPDRVRFMASIFDVPLLQMSHRLSLIFGLFMLLLADEILLRVRRAWTACLILLAFGGIFTFIKGFDFEELMYLSLVMILLWFSRPVFFRRSSPIAPARLLRPLLLTAFMASFYIFSGQPHPIAFLWSHTGISMLHFTPTDYINNGVAALLMVWIVYAIWLKTMEKPPLDRVPPSAENYEKLKRLLSRFPGNSHTHLLYLRDKRFFWSSDDRVLIPYQQSGTCLTALGEPLGDPYEVIDAMESFSNFAELYGLTPVFYQVGESLLPSLHDQGFGFFKLGEEAFVELEDFDLNLSHFKGLRNVRNRIEREGYAFEMLPAGQFSELFSELRTISDIWLSGRREKQFSLGFFDESYLSLSPIALIRAPQGKIVAFASLMPAYRDMDEISVDLMRFLPETPNGTMDYLFLRLLLWARESGYARFNFGMAPLSNVGQSGYPTAAERLAGFMYSYGNRLYSFTGLYQYKKKFHPDWRPKYLAYPHRANLTSILLSVANLINRGNISEPPVDTGVQKAESSMSVVIQSHFK